MRKEDFVKLGIDEETAKKCETDSHEELKGYIPKSRFDEVNNEKKKLELDVRDRDGQLETLKIRYSLRLKIKHFYDIIKIRCLHAKQLYFQGTIINQYVFL